MIVILLSMIFSELVAIAVSSDVRMWYSWLLISALYGVLAIAVSEINFLRSEKRIISDHLSQEWRERLGL